ncbi:MAG: hypothetical protein ABSG03_38665, partial [Bryobacteraceae bacterium]
MKQQSTLFPIIPPLLPNESMIGYLQRIAILNTGRAFQPVVRSIVGRSAIQLPWITPTRLERIAQQLHDAIPTASVLLHRHTIFPALIKFSSLEDRITVERRMIDGTCPGPYFILGLAHRVFSSRITNQT